MPIISTTQQKIRQALAQTLESAGGAEANPAAIADAAVQAWIRVATQLAKLIGAEGVRAVYARCLLLTRETFPWLPPAEIATSQMKVLADLREALEGRGPADALGAITTLLFNLTDLLGKMIGESLTTHLLDSAWGHPVLDKTNKELPT